MKRREGSNKSAWMHGLGPRALSGPLEFDSGYQKLQITYQCCIQGSHFYHRYEKL